MARVGEARQTIRDLRRGRFDRPPGAVARDLLDRTAFARVVALGANGAQRLTRLRELCFVLGQIAAAEGLDYDATTARMREWVTNPIELDPPHPVGADAVRVLTVHQAKGLEFPVVVLWDGRFTWDTKVDQGAWRMGRNDDGWVVNLHGLQWEEPAGQDLRKKEKTYLDEERQRVIYVAATRARDLLVVEGRQAGSREARVERAACRRGCQARARARALRGRQGAEVGAREGSSTTARDGRRRRTRARRDLALDRGC
jgi:ATP-dependent helicase/nuclease subunit A